MPLPIGRDLYRRIHTLTRLPIVCSAACYRRRFGYRQGLSWRAACGRTDSGSGTTTLCQLVGAAIVSAASQQNVLSWGSKLCSTLVRPAGTRGSSWTETTILGERLEWQYRVVADEKTLAIHLSTRARHDPCPCSTSLAAAALSHSSLAVSRLYPRFIKAGFDVETQETSAGKTYSRNCRRSGQWA